jgi:hypothetical protein
MLCARRIYTLIGLLLVAALSLPACTVTTRTEPLPSGEASSTPGTAPGPSGQSTSPNEEVTSGAEATGPLELKVGETASYTSGLNVTVTSAGRGPADMSGAPTYKIAVRYDNKGTDTASFNELDWQIEDSNGARTNNTAVLSENAPTLGSGELAPGGSKIGDIYFTANGRVAKIVYSASLFSGEEARATWTVTSPAVGVYNEAQDLDKRIGEAADHINSELGSASTVSNDTLLECQGLRDEVQAALSDARGLSDPRGKLLAQVLQLHLTRAQALVDGATAAREGTDYTAAFKRGQDAKTALGWMRQSDGTYRLAASGLQAKVNAAFGK